MRPLSALSAEEAGRLRGVIFDLDGTVLTDGQLSREAYAAVCDLAATDLRLVICTGRPASWAEVLQRQWPVDAVMSENGAIGYSRAGAGLKRWDRHAHVRGQRRAQLRHLVASLRVQLPQLQLADDNRGRLSDTTIDIAETVQLERTTIDACHDVARALGGHTFESSIHLHVTLERDDKASGTVWLLRQLYREDPSAMLAHYAFIGDSANDAACFNVFRTSIGVANVARHLPHLGVSPRYVCSAAAGAGFAEFARHLLRLRQPSQGGP